jgi:hypothetical protein
MVAALVELASAELYAGHKQAAQQAASQSERIADRFSTAAGQNAIWKLSQADAARLVRAAKSIPALHSSKTAPPALSDARKFLNWARGTGNPFIEMAGMRMLALSLIAEGQWNDAIVYLAQMSEAHEQLVARTTLRERLLQAARLDYMVLSGEGLARVKQANYQTAASFLADFAEACLGPLREADELDEDDEVEVHKRVEAVKTAAASAEAHRVNAIAQAAQGHGAEAAKQIDLEFSDVQTLLAGLNRLSVTSQRSDNDFSGFGTPNFDDDADSDKGTDTDTDSDSDAKPSRKQPVKLKPELAYLRDLEKAMVLRDYRLVTRAAEQLANAVESGQPGAAKVEVPLVLGGYGEIDSGLSYSPLRRDWQGAVGLRLLKTQDRADTLPWVSGVPRGKVVADLSKVGLEEAASSDMPGGTGQGLAKEQSSLYAGLYASQMAAALAGNHDFIALPGELTNLIQAKPSVLHWAGILSQPGSHELVRISSRPARRRDCAPGRIPQERGSLRNEGAQGPGR